LAIGRDERFHRVALVPFDLYGLGIDIEIALLLLCGIDGQGRLIAGLELLESLVGQAVGAVEQGFGPAGIARVQCGFDLLDDGEDWRGIAAARCDHSDLSFSFGGLPAQAMLGVPLRDEPDDAGGEEQDEQGAKKFHWARLASGCREEIVTDWSFANPRLNIETWGTHFHDDANEILATGH
jgi:hypothetical protein